MEWITNSEPITRMVLLAIVRESEINGKGRGMGRRLAQQIQCSPAYITRLLKGECLLSCEQAHLLAKHLELNSEETHWLLLATCRDRAGTYELRIHFEGELKRLRFPLESTMGSLLELSRAKMNVCSPVYS